jgi:hypothetical protein
MILVKGASEKRVVSKRLCYPPQEQLKSAGSCLYRLYIFGGKNWAILSTKDTDPAECRMQLISTFSIILQLLQSNYRSYSRTSFFPN